ncbi:MAG: RagB/SusD family nutrient uptake outer membrane protein [Zunongwangia sp.]|uniref:RagB/SusD family nutrient uptake outer membrane protein n=1 Tax=Zunongwangia profunda TaxID=398743 RepID=A0A3D5J316_9FLAO|nr:RagB/SusD family nutrient uptake outer membrane protein [Zunongwangia profunda]MAG85959.1 RagB/SusD family nutrient uptake outer membrane protein [Flavobacteriaceae bacterium]MAO34605.1 RagB/SusD family nutrient uptake outer membrane protein [Zunongwangia sp.]HCV82489.1 RagB/SusD family nutrient uptake outer membrane protein [Zunongwangia profunda]|tara:strand:- start:8795 stop:10210 length:1416 start_codon:yes stop_codon:yes gene_type:complete
MTYNKIQSIYIPISKRKILFVKSYILALVIIGLNSCTDFVEVDPPKNILVSETVFEDPATVESALANVYYTMRQQGIVGYDLSADMGIYADEMDYYGSNSNDLSVYIHSITPINSNVSNYWNNAYTLIYAVNDIINGVEDSSALSVEEKATFKGQALFVRAFLHFTLVNIFGDIPLITTPDYRMNNTTGRTPVNEVNEAIIEDLILAVSLMDASDPTGERVIPNKAAANALLARVYLYTENWELAESTSTILIDQFELETNLSNVFLKESVETIWQFKPDPTNIRNTSEANQFIIQTSSGNHYALTNVLMNSFEEEDLRREQWVGNFTSADGSTSLYFPYKYKALLSEVESLEYSIVFRLAEQYLIRAESRAQLGNISGAQNDLNNIRNRAGLDDTAAGTQSTLLAAILQERFVELFSEQGHRWFDIRRTGKAGENLESLKPNWKTTDTIWPIPESELELNPNLLPQNPGY